MLLFCDELRGKVSGVSGWWIATGMVGMMTKTDLE